MDGDLDCRNYGELAGIPSARAYWADVLGCKPEQTFIGGPSSLTLMSDDHHPCSTPTACSTANSPGARKHR